MTTIVRRGQNRARAEAIRKKHAQRTPLPMSDLPANAVRGLNGTTGMVHWACPTGSGRLEQLCGAGPKQHAYLSPAPDATVSCKRCLGRYGDSKIKESAPDDLDKMSVSQLRQLARAQGWSLLDNVTKSQIVFALREHPGGAPADAQPLGTRKSVNGNRKESKVDLGQQIAARIKAARENGYSRKDIADASGLTQSVVWRMQAKERVKAHEVDAITEALDKIERGEIQPTRRGRPAGKTQTGRAALQSKLDRIEEILSDVAMTSKPAEYREAINRALDVINE